MNNFVSYDLGVKYKILIVFFSSILFLISYRLFTKEKIILFFLFLCLGLILISFSTYKKNIYFIRVLKELKVQKQILGFGFSEKKSRIDKNSTFKLHTESSLGHDAGGRSTRHLILSIDGVVSNAKDSFQTKRQQIDLCSEHLDSRKKIFISKANYIAEQMGVPISHD